MGRRLHLLGEERGEDLRRGGAAADGDERDGGGAVVPFADRLGALRAPARGPARDLLVDVRLAHGERRGGERGADGGLVALQVAEDGVREAGGRGAVERLERLDGGMHRGVGGDVRHQQDLRGAEQERGVGVRMLRTFADERVDGERERAGVSDGRVDQVHHEPAAEGRDGAEHSVGELAGVRPASENLERVRAGERSVVGGREARPFCRSGGQGFVSAAAGGVCCATSEESTIRRSRGQPRAFPELST